MSNIAAMSQLARIAETVQGTPPANAAAWIAGGTRIHHIAETLDMSGVERNQLVDERNQTRVFANESMVEGIDNPEFPFSLYGHGLGVVTADAVQVSADPAVTLGIELMFQLEQALGGITRGTSTTTSGAGSTTTAIDVTDASTYEEGEYVAIGLTTNLPSKYPAGTAFPRRIIAVTLGAPDNITLDQALPGIPVDTDPIHACVVAYPDEDILCDSNAAGGPHTWTYLAQKGLPGATVARLEAWEFRGTVQTLQSFELSRDEKLTFAMVVMAGSHADPATPAPSPTWTQVEEGLAPLAIGPLTELWLEDDGTDTDTEVQISSIAIEPGVPRNRVETTTSDGVFMQATSNYATSPADTTITLSLTPFGIAQWTEQSAGTQKQLRWARLGPAGSGFAIAWPRVSHMATPKRNINDAVSESMVTFLAHEENDFSPAPTNVNRAKAKMVFVAW